jgi:predicted transcriptional regulator
LAVRTLKSFYFGKVAGSGRSAVHATFDPSTKDLVDRRAWNDILSTKSFVIERFMARTKSPTLTEAELRVMEVIWERDTATVAEITEALRESAGLAYTTILTMTQILEKKGYLAHQKAGRAFVYRPIVAKEVASCDAIKHLIKRFFNNSAELLMLNLLKNENISSRELKRLKKMIIETK